MTYQELVDTLQGSYGNADASSIKGHVAIQFNITGEAAGALYLEVKDGKLDIQPYEYYDRDALVTTSAKVLLDIASGKQDVVAAFLTKKIAVEGDLGKAASLKDIKLK